MIIYLLIYTQIICMAAEIYNGSLFYESKKNFSQHIWHSYTFNTGTGNREELHFENVGFNSNFESVDRVFLWKSLQVQEKIIVIGLGNDFLIVTTLHGENNSFTYKEEIQSPAKTLAVFQKWNAKTQGIESFIIVVTCTFQENCILKWYQILNTKLKFLWDWPFNGNISYIDIIQINYQSRLLIVNSKGNNYKICSADIYSFRVNYYLDIWLFEKIILDAIPSSVTVFDNMDNIFLSVSFPSMEMIHIFKYSKTLCLDSLEKKHFVPHQQIFSIGLKSLISFRVGFRWYLAVASKTSLIYNIGEDLLFQPVSTFKLSSFNNWLVIPVDTYREDTILLANSNSDVSVITWTADERLVVLGSFVELACKDDTYCMEKLENIALNGSTAFGLNGLQNLIISTKYGSPLFFKLHLTLKPLPDKVTLKLRNIIDMKTSLEKDYVNQNQEISDLLSEKQAIVTEDSTEFSNKTVQASQLPETVSQTKKWSEIMSDVYQLKATVQRINRDVEKYLTDLKSDTSPQNGQYSNAILTKNVTDGITFYGDVLISDLNLSNLNGFDVNELLTDSFRANKGNKIGGKKTLKHLIAENVIFEKIGDTLACDVVFSDELLEERNKNIINGDIFWENNLNVLNNVIIIPQVTRVNNPSSGKISRETLKHVYDSLNLEELEVTEDAYIQRTVNGQPFILPAHGGQLNILDTVNQAQIEVVNVEQNLNVAFINGKNFSHLLNNMLLKPPSQYQFDIIKIKGIFSAPVLQTDHLNGIDLSEERPVTGRDEFSGKFFANVQSSYTGEKNLKKAQFQNLKRTIHVFQNLEVDGILFSNKINNISWVVLNDTIKKDEETVSLTGTKKFEKLLTINNTKLSGTLNGRFVDHILNNFSNQIVRLRQTFDNIKFKNLSLEGSWDGVFLNQLNNSVVRVSSKNGEGSSLSFEEECFVNILNVTDFVNDINLKEKKVQSKTNKTEFKFIKATNVILHGSLITNNKINNINFTNFSLLRVSLKSPETIQHNLIHNNVTISGELNVQTLNLNDVSSIIKSGGDTNLIEKFLNGKINRIKKLLVKGNIVTSQGVNGVNVSKIIEKGVCITKPSSIKGNITFENIIYFDNINVTNSIDGVSLKKLEKDIAFRHSHVFLSGPKKFSTLKVIKSMKARSLNGHLVEDIVSLKGDQTMKGHVHINGDVTVKGNVLTYAAINNINVPDLIKTYSTKVNFFICSGDLNLKSDKVTIENLLVNGSIQNVSLDALVNDTILKEGGFNILGKKSFKGEVKIKGNASLKGFIHGVNFSEFYSDVAFINKPMHFEGTIIIQESVLKLLETSDYFNSSLINNFDTNEWLEDSIPLDKYEIIHGKKTFEEAHVLQDVSVDFVNGHLPSAMISLKKKQHIPSLALFPRIHTTSDVSVSGLVNGWNLKKEFQATVLMYGHQTISGKTVFDQDFIINGTLFVNSLKGKSVNNLITLDTEQIIKSPLEFKGLVTAKKDVKSLKIVNNISLHDWDKNSVSLNRAQILNGLWTVKGRVKSKNIDGKGLLHAASLPDVSNDLQKNKLRALDIKNATKMEYFDQCHKIEKLSEQFSKMPYLFYQFEMVDEIETSSLIDSVITFKINNENHLIITFSNECLSNFYKWNTSSSNFDYLRQINIGTVDKWSVIYRNNGTYLITSSLKSRIICEENLKQGNVWLFQHNLDKYTHLLSTNAFVDITHENNTSNKFFTIDENGTFQQWTFEENGNISSKFLLSVGQNNYRFIDFRIMGGLAISNGREIKRLALFGDKIIQNNISLINAQIEALPIEGKTLIAVVLKDKIVIYENVLEDKIVSVIHTYRAGSVLWFNYGAEKQAFLIVASHHRLIEVYEYKRVAGLVKIMSIQMFSSRLQSETLPIGDKFQSDKFLIVIQKKKLIFMRADMLGDLLKKDVSFC